MKKAFIFFSCIVMLIAAGCGSDNENSTETTTGTRVTDNVVLGETAPEQTTKKAVEGAIVPDSTTVTSENSDTDTTTATTAATQPPAGTSAGISTADLKLRYKGVTLTPGADMSELVKKLGEPDSLQKAPSCAYEGDDKTYVYGELTIYTFPAGASDKISEIALGGASISTDRGARVGMTLAELEAIYGKAYTLDGSYLKYDLGSSGFLYATLSDNKITTLGISEK